MNPDAAILAELHRLRHRLPVLSGVVLAGADGLLITSDVAGIDPHHVAALSAASLGLGYRFAEAVGHGFLHESVVRATAGALVTYPAGGNGLLTLLVHPETDVAQLRPYVYPAAQRLGVLVETLRQQTGFGEAPVAADPRAPLAMRTPMATLPPHLWPDAEGRRPRFR